MSLDKANSKLLVEIKKLHVPDNPDGLGANPETFPKTIHEIDLVNGGDDAPSAEPAQAAGNTGGGDGEGAGYDLC